MIGSLIKKKNIKIRVWNKFIQKMKNSNLKDSKFTDSFGSNLNGVILFLKARPT